MKLNFVLWPACAAFAVCVAGVSRVEAQLPPVPAGATAVVQGVYGPRGLKFGPDGDLYVALSGSGGSTPNCTDVPGGPYYGGSTASIIKIDPQGNVTTVASDFPSTFNPGTASAQGVGDIAFLDGELYAVTAGGGCGHGNPSQPNMVAKVNPHSHKWTMIADMSAAVAAQPAVNVDDEDFQPDGDFYTLVATRGRLFTVEPNHGQVWSVTTDGEVEMVTDISKTEGHAVPTAAVANGGGLIVGNLGTFPISPGTEKLLTLEPGCAGGRCKPGTLRITGSTTGLTTVVGLAWGPDGQLYALELSSPQQEELPPYFPNPGDGKVVRVRRDGTVEDVFTGLSVPTAMTFGPDGALYVSNWGAAPAPIGQILRISVASGGRPGASEMPEQ